MRDFSETKSDEHGSSLSDEDALFSQYLGFRSPLCSLAQDTSNNHDSDGDMHSQTVIPSDICLYAEESLHSMSLIHKDTTKPKKVSVTTTKPRITFRLRQPKPRSKPKILLRLSQPKQILTQKSSHRKPGIKARKKRGT